MEKYAPLALIPMFACCVWIIFSILRVTLKFRRQVLSATGSHFFLFGSLSLFWLYMRRPSSGFWDLDKTELEYWLQNLELELTEAEALQIARKCASIIKGKPRTEAHKWCEECVEEERNVYNTARELIGTVRSQARLGGQVLHVYIVFPFYFVLGAAGMIVSGYFLFKVLLEQVQ